MVNPEVLTLIERQLAMRPRLLSAWTERAAQMERQLGIRPIVAIPELDLPGMARRGAGPRLGDMRQKMQALPPMVLVCLGLTGVLMVAAALV